MTTSIALLSPIYVTVFWSILFLSQKKSANPPRWILGIYMLLAALLYVSHAIFFSRMYFLYSFFESIYIYSGLSLYPLFYTYILKLTTIKLKLPRHYFHFIPGILLGLISLIITFFLSHEQRIYYVKYILIETNLQGVNLNTLPGIKGWIFLLSRIVFIAQTLIYLALIIRLANKHNQTINNYFSNTEGKKMNWVRNLSITAFIVSGMAIVFALLGRSYFIHHNLSLLAPSAFFSTIFFLIGFKGNQQHQIVESLYENDKPKEEFTVSSEEELKNRLINLFETEKIYQLNDLRINTVCESLHTNRTYISKLINDEFGMNFNEFTNKYRVDEAKRLMVSKANNIYTMEHIAREAGFGSVASFSRVFKEIEGTTPGKYRKKYNGVS
ncbi:helix-turn-helix domain-containing protein [Draconibacterium sp. IB214405]|uniref:helix-turn-helix domain-containing protein n=1 Tax=Draconibacterium sp. IB214405 TaxID=3097352 RepID=UPI002A0F0D60|nr:helix-turn-helix domain-containing protein [Draconibacterium sp. IB214405]MDX8337719.1 helix-turn-helix domain-containing protein [Draconibacterium sp. IB214405]